MSSNVRPETMERITDKALAEVFIENQVKEIREQAENYTHYEEIEARYAAISAE